MAVKTEIPYEKNYETFEQQKYFIYPPPSQEMELWGKLLEENRKKLIDAIKKLDYQAQELEQEQKESEKELSEKTESLIKSDRTEQEKTSLNQDIKTLQENIENRGKLIKVLNSSSIETKQNELEKLEKLEKNRKESQENLIKKKESLNKEGMTQEQKGLLSKEIKTLEEELQMTAPEKIQEKKKELEKAFVDVPLRIIRNLDRRIDKLKEHMESDAYKKAEQQAIDNKKNGVFDEGDDKHLKISKELQELKEQRTNLITLNKSFKKASKAHEELKKGTHSLEASMRFRHERFSIRDIIESVCSEEGSKWRLGKSSKEEEEEEVQDTLVIGDEKKSKKRKFSSDDNTIFNRNDGSPLGIGFTERKEGKQDSELLIPKGPLTESQADFIYKVWTEAKKRGVKQIELIPYREDLAAIAEKAGFPLDTDVIVTTELEDKTLSSYRWDEIFGKKYYKTELSVTKYLAGQHNIGQHKSEALSETPEQRNQRIQQQLQTQQEQNRINVKR